MSRASPCARPAKCRAVAGSWRGTTGRAAPRSADHGPAATGAPRGRSGRARRNSPSGRSSAGDGQVRVLAQHAQVQIPQLGPGLGTQVPGQQSPGPVIGGQGLGATPGPVQRQHELRMEPFVQGLLGGVALHLQDQFGVPSQVQVGVHPPFQRLQPDALQPRRYLPPQRVGRNIGQRLIPPQRQRRGQQAGRAGPVRRAHRRGAVAGQFPELQQVQFASVQSQLVTGVAGDNPRVRRGEQPAQALDVVAQGHPGGGRRGTADSPLLTIPPGYLLADRAVDLDLAEFSGLMSRGLDAAEAGDPAAASELLADALALWRGTAFTGVGAIPILAAAEGLDARRLMAADAKAEADLELGRYATVVTELSALLIAHPLRERSRGLAMLALDRLGCRADALGLYRSGERALRGELGIEPGGWLRGVHDRILTSDAGTGAGADDLHPRPFRWMIDGPGAGGAPTMTNGVTAIRAGAHRATRNP